MELLFGGILSYFSVAVFICGTVLRIAAWLRVPVPFQLTLFPEPRGILGKATAVAGEFLFCRTRYRENRLLWLWVWLFHFFLTMVLVGHVLGIYFLRHQFTLIGASPDTSARLSTALGAVMGTCMIVSLTMLLCRRVFNREIRKLSEPFARFDLLLLFAIALSGLCMYLPGYHADLPLVRAYMANLIAFRLTPLPPFPLFGIHFFLANFLLLYFPFSHLIHSAGFFVIRAMLIETSPAFPSSAGKRLRSPFANRKIDHGTFASPAKETDAGETACR